MFKDERAGLIAMTLRAAFTGPRHGQAAGGFEDVAAVRIVAVHAIHPPFNDRMMLGQVKFSMRIEMALKTGGGVVARVDDEAGRAAGFDMFAARAVTGFAASLAGHARRFQNAPAREDWRGICGQCPCDASPRRPEVADVLGAGDVQRDDGGARSDGARDQKQSGWNTNQQCHHEWSFQCSPIFICISNRRRRMNRRCTAKKRYVA